MLLVVLATFNMFFVKIAHSACMAGDTTKPAAVSISVPANGISDTGAFLIFTAPTDPSGLGNYVIKVSTVAITTRNFGTLPSSGNQPQGTPGSLEGINIPGLAPLTKYYVAVAATDGCGNVSAMSNVVSFTTTAAPPPKKCTVVLQWDHNTEADLAGYRVKYNTTSWLEFGPQQTWQYVQEAGMNNTATVVLQDFDCSEGSSETMYFIVTAFNTAGQESSPSNEVHVP
ncbi:hypothetical protein HGA64_02525 [Candidatus Falkowbacteria bacterium]|nr:hypothetical protein [Candidatus Falkowbacteria bacterium]